MKNKNIAILLLFTFFGMHLYAQQSNNPLSAYGIGEILDANQTGILGSGWNKNAYQDPFHANMDNPASLSYLLSSSFELGIGATQRKLKNPSDNSKFWEGNFDNISVAFPLFSPINAILDKKESNVKWGMGLALRPISTSSYKYELVQIDANNQKVTNNLTGNGGIYKLIYNNGVSYKKIRFGLGLEFNFGEISSNRLIGFPDDESAFYTSERNTSFYSGFQSNFGIMYDYVFKTIDSKGEKILEKDQKKLTFGFTFRPHSNLKGDAEIFTIKYNPFVASSLAVDTLVNENSRKSKGKFYSTIGFGLNYLAGQKSSFHINYNSSDFSKIVSGNSSNLYQNNSQLSLGYSWTPVPNSYISVFKRAKYSIGGRYGTLPLSINNEKSNILSGVVSISAPIYLGRQISFIDLGLELGTKTFGLGYKEQFAKIFFGVCFNDDYWFLKRKYD